MERDTNPIERRRKSRFPITREVRYKLLDNDRVAEYGTGETIDIGSGGIAFTAKHRLKEGCFIELSVSWPVLLGDTCPMRLVVYGRVLRGSHSRVACTVDKYEFRTQARRLTVARPERSDSLFQRWVDTFRKDSMKARVCSVSASI